MRGSCRFPTRVAQARDKGRYRSGEEAVTPFEIEWFRKSKNQTKRQRMYLYVPRYYVRYTLSHRSIS